MLHLVEAKEPVKREDLEYLGLTPIQSGKEMDLVIALLERLTPMQLAAFNAHLKQVALTQEIASLHERTVAMEAQRRAANANEVDFDLIDAIGRARDAGDPHADADTAILKTSNREVTLWEIDETE